MDGLRKFIAVDNSAAGKIRDLEKKQSKKVVKPKFTTDFPGAVVQKGADELTLRAHEEGAMRAFALAFMREVFASPDVSHVAGATLAPCRRCQVKGAELDELLLVTGLALLLQEKSPCETLREALHATDASPSGAGGCVAPMTQEAWLSLYDFAEEKGEHVRLDWRDEDTPNSVHDGRAAAVPLALDLDWVTMFAKSLCSAKRMHIVV